MDVFMRLQHYCDEVGENTPFVPIFTINATQLTNLTMLVNCLFSHMFMINLQLADTYYPGFVCGLHYVWLQFTYQQHFWLK